ncbi:serine hydrolase domain-containing protein [Streptomyces sp. NPDC059802]|uniref:serine hydrolase domain-containing protein n=1 Tax=Streptomyces sp. NPDC059802 TaxID=3346952 RepID=UPI00364960D8
MTTSRRHAKSAVIAGAAALALMTTACDDAAKSAPPTDAKNSASPTGAAKPAPSSDATTQRRIDAVAEQGIPGVQVVISDPGRGTRILRAGTGNTDTGKPFPDDARVRIGSNTKAFVATVVMQLVDEGRVDLNRSVEHYLPGRVRGNGNDGSRVKIRDLLQHTSGLTDYVAAGGTKPEDIKPGQLRLAESEEPQRHYTPDELLKIAMSLPPGPAAKDSAVYSNTNYILLGMLIEKVTGHPAPEEITTRIIDRLGLKNTYFPKSGETDIRGPHARGYHRIGEKQVDVTDGDVSWAYTAGAMVATGADLNTFFTALLHGDLVSKDRLAEMKRTVPLNKDPKDGYGLGLVRVHNSCGKEIWGHGGGIPGFMTAGGVDPKGRAVALTFNHVPMSEKSNEAVMRAVDAAVCGD